MSSIFKRQLVLIFIVIRRQETMRSAVAIIADSSKVSRLLASACRIAQVVDLRGWFSMTERADAACEANHLEAEIIPPFQFFVGWLKGKHEVLPNSSQANRCGSTMAFRNPFRFCVKRRSSGSKCYQMTSDDIRAYQAVLSCPRASAKVRQIQFSYQQEFSQ